MKNVWYNEKIIGGTWMDALEILSDLENVFPYFQPIFNADEQRVIAYEVLGRYLSKGKAISLGPFFMMIKFPMNINLR